ncbi:MAG: DUF5518 domain-containing protein [Candidatus Methanoperedens sp.]|nr:DUF5518 domain-containing protein [Candidatus Methanoperedens sp.]
MFWYLENGEIIIQNENLSNSKVFPNWHAVFIGGSIGMILISLWGFFNRDVPNNTFVIITALIFVFLGGMITGYQSPLNPWKNGLLAGGAIAIGNLIVASSYLVLDRTELPSGSLPIASGAFIGVLIIDSIIGAIGGFVGEKIEKRNCTK